MNHTKRKRLDRIWRSLEREPGIKAGKVASRMGVHRSAVTRALPAMEGLHGDWTVRLRAPLVWNVVTRAGSSGYTIRQTEGAWSCDCPDFAKNGLGMCKHTAAVELTQEAQESEGGA